MSRPTIADVTGDSPLAQLARKHWLKKAPSKVLPDTIKELWDAVEADDTSYTLLLLEQLQALERYLWPGYNDDSSNHHVLLLTLLANVKRQERLPVWPLFADRPDEFSSLFQRITHLSVDRSLPAKTRTQLLVFLIGALQSLDSGLVRKELAPLVSIGTWHFLHSDREREQQLAKSPQLQKAWRAAEKKFDNADAPGQARLKFERSWLYTLCLDFFDRLYRTEGSADVRHDDLLYSERFLELLCDLLSQLPTRRYVNTLLHDLNILSVIRLSPLYQDGNDTRLLRDMYQLLEHYASFPIDDHSGRSISAQDHHQAHNARIARLQNTALKLHPDELKILVLASYGSLGQRQELLGHLRALDDAAFLELCAQLGVRTSYPSNTLVVEDRTFLEDALSTYIEQAPLFTEKISHTSDLPTETSLYNPSLLRTDEYDGSRPLAIPKLNLQYLTTDDFLWRSYTLYRDEAFYEIRKHVEDTIKRLQPRLQATNVRFDGFSKMAIPIAKPAIIEVVPPKVGEDVPAEVRVEIILDVGRLQPGLRREWENLRHGDVVFLVGVSPHQTEKLLTNGHGVESEAEKAGVKVLRSAEVIHVTDDHGKPLRSGPDQQNGIDNAGRPRQRRLLLRLDAASYKTDKERADAGKGDVLDSVNLIIRRGARENNFKSLLSSLKQLTLSDAPMPSWLREVFLGFGDPSSASYKRLPNRLKSIDFRDTFLDWQHLVEALPGKTMEPDPTIDGSFPPPYVLEGTEQHPEPISKPSRKRRRDQPDGPNLASAAESFKVTTYPPPNNGPYPTDLPKVNSIRFTPAQIEAVTSGTQPGLTVIVGPPGTGKTDVASQIINNIYHNFPQERTLLIAHSNQALNQLFQKITRLDVDDRHLLRLGHGEEELDTEANFGKAGRVESFLERGGHYLSEVQRLASSIGAPGAHGSSCETADYFDQVYVLPSWKRCWDQVDKGADVASSFPFHGFFANAPQPLFPADADVEQLKYIAKGCERHIRKIFTELAEIRPFEILRAQRDKANYLLVKEARIIAMTSTHAAMRRQEIANMGFRYDNVIMEETAQIMEAESFIPLVMQAATSTDESGGLKRIVLVGDHLQNSPVIPNAAFRTYANLEQSLFKRFIRLGVPHVMLDAQGRSRPSLAQLYKWRYPQLTSLPLTTTQPEFLRANAGFRYDYQFIDVPDYKGKGESEPSPHFIQNLGEAEYAVALYQYMRLLGYPAQRISILAMYAGQRALIRDVLERRCKQNRLFGMPGWLGTVDKYQGEQNDYIILSMVRTKAPGYLRDIRRLTVALSRARLGLYILGRRQVFESSLELRDAFALLFERPNTLALVAGEMFPATRAAADEVASVDMEGVEHLGQYVYEMTKAKIQALKEGNGTLPPPALTSGGGDEDDADHHEEADDGEDVDGADEEDIDGVVA